VRPLPRSRSRRSSGRGGGQGKSWESGFGSRKVSRTNFGGSTTRSAEPPVVAAARRAHQPTTDPTQTATAACIFKIEHQYEGLQSLMPPDWSSRKWVHDKLSQRQPRLNSFPSSPTIKTVGSSVSQPPGRAKRKATTPPIRREIPQRVVGVPPRWAGPQCVTCMLRSARIATLEHEVLWFLAPPPRKSSRRSKNTALPHAPSPLPSNCTEGQIVPFGVPHRHGRWSRGPAQSGFAFTVPAPTVFRLNPQLQPGHRIGTRTPRFFVDIRSLEATKYPRSSEPAAPGPT